MNATMTYLSPDDLERLAHKRAAAKLGWYVHATVYVVVNLFLLAVSTHGFGLRPWSVFPVLGWGVGLALHGVAVFLLADGGGLRRRLLERERERLRREQEHMPRP